MLKPKHFLKRPRSSVRDRDYIKYKLKVLVKEFPSGSVYNELIYEQIRFFSHQFDIPFLSSLINKNILQ